MRKYGPLLRYPLRQWPALVLIFGLAAALSAAAALQPWPMKVLIDALGDAAAPAVRRSWPSGPWGRPTTTTLVFASGLAGIAVFLLNAALETGLNWAWTWAGQRMVYDAAADLFARIQRMSLLYHSRRPVGDSLSRLSDTWSLYAVADGLLISPWQQSITLAVVGVVAWTLDPQLGALSLAAAPAMAASAVFFGRRLKRRIKSNREAHARLTSFVQQVISATPVVQAFSAEERNRREFDRLAADSIGLAQQGNLLSSTQGLVNGLIATAGTGLVVFVGGRRVLAGSLSVGSLYLFLAYLKTLQTAAQGLLRTYTSVKAAEASIDRVLEVLESDDPVREAPDALPPNRPARGHVRIEDVSVGYEPGRPVLHGVSLEAGPGEVIALVGPTGAGKSTLAALIPRFLDPWDGRITLDGVDARRLTLAGLRDSIALVLQEPFLLPMTVAHNIAYGRPDASHAEVEDAAIAANADEFIRRLPHGYDTLLGERGATLSGGQRQRLAIARALLKDAPVLVLDEPTSALDSRTEAAVLEALRRLVAGRTTFVIAHRLSTVRDADRIVVLDAGRVVQQGTHQELLEQGGLYERLFRNQFDAPTVAATGGDASP